MLSVAKNCDAQYKNYSTCVYKCMCACVYVQCTCTCIHLCAYTLYIIYIYMYMYVHMYVLANCELCQLLPMLSLGVPFTLYGSA